MAESIVKLAVEDSSFNAHIKRAAKEFADFGSKVANVGVNSFMKFAKGAETAKVAFQNFNKALKANAIMFVASLAIEAGQAIGDMIYNWVTGADEAEAAQKKLNEALERTGQLIKDINASTDFNSRIAKAMGKSTTDILKQELNGAKLAYNVADLKVKFLPKNASQEARDAAIKLRDEAKKRLKAAEQNLYLDEVARKYQTGEYAPKSGGKVNTKKEKLGGIYGPMAMAEGVGYTTTLQDVTKAFTPDTTGMSALDKLEAKLKSLTEQQEIFGRVSAEAWQMFQAEIDSAQEDIDTFKGKNKAGAKVTNESWKDAAAAMESVGSALASIEDPSAKIAGLIGQAIANIALGFAQATASDSKLGVFGWIAAIAGGMATMLSTISAIHSATGYAQGGIIPGNNYSGDTQWARVNSGELILNRSQQANLANQLSEGSPFRNMVLTATLSGEDLRLAINRNGKRTGRGEIVTTGFKMQ